MGHSSKKKKKRSGGRRTPSKDHDSFSAQNAELISDELTALCAIFQEDCEVARGSPPQVNIKLRPYSKDTGYENSDVSALLSVRFIPGYPNKCPKLQIVPEKGLSETDTEKLLSLLHDQANSNSREGRVMIYSLVEAAQEFLSEIVPKSQTHESVPSQATETSKLSCKDGASSSSMIYSSRGPFAYAYLDLFSGSGESWHWNLTMEGNTAISSSARSNPLEDSKYVDPNLLNRVEQKLKPAAVQEAKQDFTFNPPLKLVTVHEETEDESKSTDSSRTLSYESVGSGAIVEDTFVEENAEDTDDDDLDSNPSKPDCSESLVHNQSSQTMKIDLILAHLLRLACAPKGQLRDVLPQITSELCDLGVVSEHVRDLAIKPSSDFDITFNDVFGHHMFSSKISQFWRTTSDLDGQNSSAIANSRYLSDFEELQPLV